MATIQAVGTMPEQTFVISDIHAAAGPLDDCEEPIELALVDFIGTLASAGVATELVINGDFLDFVKAPPVEGDELSAKGPDGIALCFTAEQSQEKIEAILEAHASVFEALGDFLGADAENQIVILPGNHDVDLFWQEIRDRLAEAILGKAASTAGPRLRFHLETTYRAAANEDVWIEHGHQYDPLNWFEFNGTTYWSEACPPILPDADGRPRLLECIGTRFMLRFLNRLNRRYPFVNNVKPFSRFIKIFGASAFHPRYGSLRAAASVWSMLRFVAESELKHPGEILEKSGSVENGSSVAGLMRELKESEALELVKRLNRAGLKINRSLEMYTKDWRRTAKVLELLAERPEILDGLDEPVGGTLDIGGGGGTLELAQGYSVDESRVLQQWAKKLIEEQRLAAVIMGHTHETRDFATPRYVNTGSWTRFLEETDRPGRAWSVLNASSLELFPYLLQYVRVTADRSSPVELKTHLEG